MQSFKDKHDKTWTLDTTGESLRRVRKLLGVDLSELTEGKPPLGMRLARDDAFIVDVLYVLLKPDVDVAGLSDEQFGVSLSPETLLAAREALRLELIDFFRRSGRKDMAEVLTTQATFMDKVTTRSLSRLGRIDLDGLLDKAEAEADALLGVPLLPIPSNPGPSGNDSKSSADSSVSTLTNTASEP